MIRVGICACLFFITIFSAHSAQSMGTFKEPIPPEMQKLCDKYGGLKVYEKAENVEGFLYGGFVRWRQDRANVGEIKFQKLHAGCTSRCVWWLLTGKYKFIETDDRNSFGFPSDNFGIGRGFHRFTMQKKGHPSCSLFERFMSEKPYAFYDLRGTLKTYCIATEKIPNPNRTYEYKITTTDERSITSTHVKKTVAKISNLRSGKILATATKYVNWGYVKGFVDKRIPIEAHCPRESMSSAIDSNLEKILSPSQR
jgi:hypothetical protein